MHNSSFKMNNKRLKSLTAQVQKYETIKQAQKTRLERDTK